MGTRLTLIRRERGLTKAAVAQLAALSPSAYAKIENGGQSGVDTIEQIAKSLGVSPAWLAFGEGPQSYRPAGGHALHLLRHRPNRGLRFRPSASEVSPSRVFDDGENFCPTCRLSFDPAHPAFGRSDLKPTDRRPTDDTRCFSIEISSKSEINRPEPAGRSSGIPSKHDRSRPSHCLAKVRPIPYL